MHICLAFTVQEHKCVLWQTESAACWMCTCTWVRGKLCVCVSTCVNAASRICQPVAIHQHWMSNTDAYVRCVVCELLHACQCLCVVDRETVHSCKTTESEFHYLVRGTAARLSYITVGDTHIPPNTHTMHRSHSLKTLISAQLNQNYRPGRLYNHRRHILFGNSIDWMG